MVVDEAVAGGGERRRSELQTRWSIQAPGAMVLEWS